MMKPHLFTREIIKFFETRDFFPSPKCQEEEKLYVLVWVRRGEERMMMMIGGSGERHQQNRNRNEEEEEDEN